MFALNLRPVFSLRGIDNPFTFLRKAGFSAYHAHNLLNPRNTSFQLRHIAKLCRLLYCTPNDLFLWIPDEGDEMPETHPVNALRLRTKKTSWKETMKTLPLEQLQELAEMIEAKKRSARKDPDG